MTLYIVQCHGQKESNRVLGSMATCALSVRRVVFMFQQEKQCKYNVTFRRIRVTIVAA